MTPPPPLVEVEGVEEQEQQEEKEMEKRDSAFIWDMGLERSRRWRRTLTASSRTLTTRMPEGVGLEDRIKSFVTIRLVSKYDGIV